MKIQIWNRKDNLKGLSKEVWFEAYPEARDKILVLVDDVEVLFLEDINCANEEEVGKYLEKRKEEQEKNKEVGKSETELLKDKLKEQEERITALSNTLDEVILGQAEEIV